MILVPFVLRIVYFMVHRRLCKVELRSNSGLSTRLAKKDASLTSFGAIRTMSPDPRRQHEMAGTINRVCQKGSIYRISYAALRAG